MEIQEFGFPELARAVRGVGAKDPESDARESLVAVTQEAIEGLSGPRTDDPELHEPMPKYHRDFVRALGIVKKAMSQVRQEAKSDNAD